MHPLVKLAKDAVEEFARTGGLHSPPEDVAAEYSLEAGTFVSLKIKGQLRGCIGTISPTTGSTAAEVVRNAVAASSEDSRFSRVTEDELEELEYSVDVLMPPEPVGSVEELDPKRYGVIVKRGPHRGLLLPDLEGVDTAAEQLRIAAMKAGIDPGDPEISIERFEVVRYR